MAIQRKKKVQLICYSHRDHMFSMYAKFPEKKPCVLFPLVRSHTCLYQGVINVRVFLENVAYARRMILLCCILLAAENTEKKRCSLLQEFRLFSPFLIMLKNGQTYLKIRKIFKVCLAIFQHGR